MKLERPPGGFLTLTEVCTANGIFEIRYHLTAIIRAIAIGVVEVSMVGLYLLKRID